MDVWMYGCTDVWMYGCMCMHAAGNIIQIRIHTVHTHIYTYPLGGCNPETMMKDCGSMKPTGSGIAQLSLLQCLLMKILMEYGTVWIRLAGQFLKPSLDPALIQIQIEKMAPTSRSSTQVRFTTLTMKSSTGRTLLSPFFALSVLNAVA